MELVPHFTVERARAFEAFDAAQFQGGIEGGEIAELHADTARSPAKFLCEIGNRRLPRVKLPEGELVVEIQHDEQFIARPFSSRRHSRKVGSPGVVDKMNDNASYSAADDAAIFAIASSLWTQLHELEAKDRSLNLSDHFNGVVQLMREVMRVGRQFEEWSCQHIDFDELTDVWPYLLQDRFAKTCFDLLRWEVLTQFDEDDCLRTALALQLPVRADVGLSVPVDVKAVLPKSDSSFVAFRIQTVRRDLEHGDICAYVMGDEPDDSNFSEPWFALYGMDDDGLCDHIADRKTYSALVALAHRLCPGIAFPERVTMRTRDVEGQGEPKHEDDDSF